MRTKKTALAMAVMGVALVGQASAAEYTWTPTAGGNYDWNAATSNWGTGFPNQAGDIANLNNNIEGNQTVRLQQNITVGMLHLGDADGTHTFTVSSGTGTNTLTFDSGFAPLPPLPPMQLPAILSLTDAGTLTHTVSAGISLNSDLTVVLPSGSDATKRPNLTISGPINLNGRQMVFTGGYVPTSGSDFTQLSLGGGDNLIGNGTIINNSESSLNLSGDKPSFTGKFILNGHGRGGSNTGTLTVTNSSVLNASEIVINGYVMQGQGFEQMGGTYHHGSGTATSTNPGQRITQNKVTFNGGSANIGGQPATTGTSPEWLEVNNTAEVAFNSGYSTVAIGAGARTLGNHWNIGTVTREAGASAYIRSDTLGGTARVTAANGESLGIGTGGVGTTSMKVIPWLQANNANGYGQNGRLAVYDPTSEGGGPVGFRALYDSERTSTLGSGVNFRSGSINLSSDLTINSFTHSSAGTANIGAGRILTVASGAVYFEGSGTLGGSGAAEAGTVNFGDVEGVVWATGSSGTTNTATIGAVIAGSGGLTKAGTGILVLTGTNIYSGQTTVGAGTLQVGDGTFASNLGGSGDVVVAAGALLKLMNEDAILDTATVTLQQFGLFNGKIELTGTETVGALYLGDQPVFGTWGATGSGAQNISDAFFSGTGVLNVVPEPGMLGAVGIGLLALLRRQRRA